MITIRNCHIINNLYGWKMSEKLPVNNFELVKDTSQFNEPFIKNYNEESNERYVLEIDAKYLEKLHENRNDLPFLPERKKIEKVCYTHKKFKTDVKSWISF